MRLLIIVIDSVAGSVVRATLKKWPIAVQRAKSVPNWPPIGHSLARSAPKLHKKDIGCLNRINTSCNHHQNHNWQTIVTELLVNVHSSFGFVIE